MSIATCSNCAVENGAVSGKKYRWIIGFILVALTQHGYALPDNSANRLTIVADSKTEVLLNPGTPASLELKIPRAGKWLLTIDQRYVDVEVRVLDALGKTLDILDAPDRRRSSEFVYFETQEMQNRFVSLHSKVQYPASRVTSVDFNEILSTESVNSGGLSRSESLRKLSKVASLVGGPERNVNEAALALCSEIVELASYENQKDLLFRAHQYMGHILLNASKLSQAKKHFQEAQQLARAANEPMQLANALHSTGFVQVLSDDFESAKQNFEQAMKIEKDVLPRYFFLQSTNNLCWMYQESGEINKAAVCLKDLLEVLRAEKEPTLLATVINNLIGISLSLGEADHALGYAEELLPLRKSLGSAKGLASAHNNTGFLFRRVNDIEKALNHYKIALKYRRLDNDVRGLGGTLNNIGYLYLVIGDPHRAELYFKEALLLRRQAQHKSGIARTLSNLGETSRQLGKISEAKSYYVNSIENWRILGNRRGICRATTQLAKVLRREVEKQRAVEILEAEYLPCSNENDALAKAGFLLESGLADGAIGKGDEARKKIDVSVGIYKSLNDSIGLASAYQSLSLLADFSDDHESAVHWAYEAITHIDSIRAVLTSNDILVQYTSVQQEIYENLIGLLMKRAHENHKLGVSALLQLEANRARTLMESVYLDTATADLDPDKKDSGEYQKARQRLADLSWQIRRSGNSKNKASDKLRLTYDLARTEFYQLEAALNEKTGKKPTPIFNLAEFQSSLRPRDLVLVYWLNGNRSYVWQIDQQKIQFHRLPAKGELEKLILEVNSDFKTPNRNRGNTSDRAKKLSALLLAGVAPDAYDRLFIVADGALSKFPFAALPSRQDSNSGQQYWLDRFEISMIPALRFLWPMQNHIESYRDNGSVVIFADPVYSKDDDRWPPSSGEQTHLLLQNESIENQGRWPRLPGTKNEAAQIAQLVGDRSVRYIGVDANRSTLLQHKFSPHDILHFATHAVAHANNSPLTGIVLSLVDEHGVDQSGLVDSLDLYQLRPAPRLVVMSACESAAGDIIAGEGLTGLARSMMYSGTETVVASLWPTGDQATMKLMEVFYKELIIKGKTPSSALREAQISVRDSHRRFRQPKFWANFIVMGKP